MKYKYLSLIFVAFFFSSCKDVISKDEYCQLRERALSGSEYDVKVLLSTVDKMGYKNVRMSYKIAEKEYNLFMKTLIYKNDFKYRGIPIVKSIDFIGRIEPIIKSQEVALCVEQAKAIEQMELCLANIPEWLDIDINQPGPCPLQGK